jgi:hypothetical protein
VPSTAAGKGKGKEPAVPSTAAGKGKAKVEDAVAPPGKGKAKVEDAVASPGKGKAKVEDAVASPGKGEVSDAVDSSGKGGGGQVERVELETALAKQAADAEAEVSTKQNDPAQPQSQQVPKTTLKNTPAAVPAKPSVPPATAIAPPPTPVVTSAADVFQVAVSAVEEFQRWTVRAAFAARVARYCADQCVDYYKELLLVLPQDATQGSRTLAEVANSLQAEYYQFAPHTSEPLQAELLVDMHNLISRLVQEARESANHPSSQPSPQEPQPAAAMMMKAAAPFPAIPVAPAAPKGSVGLLVAKPKPASHPEAKPQVQSPRSQEELLAEFLKRREELRVSQAEKNQESRAKLGLGTSVGSMSQLAAEPKAGLNKIPIAPACRP